MPHLDASTRSTTRKGAPQAPFLLRFPLPGLPQGPCAPGGVIGRPRQRRHRTTVRSRHAARQARPAGATNAAPDTTSERAEQERCERSVVDGRYQADCESGDRERRRSEAGSERPPVPMQDAGTGPAAGAAAPRPTRPSALAGVEKALVPGRAAPRSGSERVVAPLELTLVGRPFRSSAAANVGCSLVVEKRVSPTHSRRRVRVGRPMIGGLASPARCRGDRWTAWRCGSRRPGVE
jgi:hypothetical protein